MDLLRTVIRRAIERDQHAAFEAAEYLHTAIDLAKVFNRFGKRWMQPLWAPSS
jgi:hypothetical protein